VQDIVLTDFQGCQTFCTLTFSYPAFVKKVRVRYLKLGLGLVLMLGLGGSYSPCYSPCAASLAGILPEGLGLSGLVHEEAHPGISTSL